MLVKSLQLIYNLHTERPIQPELQLCIFVLSYLKWYSVVWEERINACTCLRTAWCLEFGSKWAIKETNAQASHRKPNTAQLSRDRFWTWFVSLSARWVGFVEHVGNFVHWPKCMNCLYIKSAIFYSPHCRGCLLRHFALSCYVKCW